MKTFMEEYGLASVMAACAMFLVVMATPVGGAINSGLQGATTSVENSGTNAEANAAKSIKSLAGEEEEVPDTIFVGYNSQNHCLVFSHDENSSGYQGCDTKYGDISNNTEFGNPNAPDEYVPNKAPWKNITNAITSVYIENTIKPQNMSYWFSQLTKISELNLSNVDTNNCINMTGIFSGCYRLLNITYGDKFNKPSGDYSQMFGSWTSVYGGYFGSVAAFRPQWLLNEDNIGWHINTGVDATSMDMTGRNYKRIIIGNITGLKNIFNYHQQGWDTAQNITLRIVQTPHNYPEEPRTENIVTIQGSGSIDSIRAQYINIKDNTKSIYITYTEDSADKPQYSKFPPSLIWYSS